MRVWGATEVGRSLTAVHPNARRSSCRHHLRQLAEVGSIRRLPVKARVWASAVVEAEVTSDRAARLADSIVGSQIDFLVLDRPPQPLHEHVVAPGALAVHAD